MHAYKVHAYKIHTNKVHAYEMYAHETHICDTLAFVDPEGIEARQKRLDRIIYSPMKALEALKAAGDNSKLSILQEVEASVRSEVSIDDASNAGEDGIGEVAFHQHRMSNLVSTCPSRNVLFSLSIWIRSVGSWGKTPLYPAVSFANDDG